MKSNVAGQSSTGKILMRKYLIVSIALAALLPVYVVAAEFMPCDPMGVGSMWRYSEQGPMGPSEVKRLVISNNAGVIEVSETSVHRFRGSEMKQEQLQILHEQDGKVILKEVSIQDGLIKKELNVPLCGYSEPDATLIGNETIEIPAGRFEAQVFEMAREGEPTDGTGMALGRQWSTIYHVPGVGTVKSIIVVEIPTPQIAQPVAQNAETAALLQEGIAAMQKGEDPSKIFEKLAELPQPAAAGGPEMSVEMKKNTITRELVEYAIE